MRLNLGSGEHPWPGWVNVDAVVRADVQMVADVRSLPLLESSVASIFAGHLIEHMFPVESRPALSHWWRLLEAGGTLGVLTPDVQRMWRMHRDDGHFTLDGLDGAFGRPDRDPKDPWAGHVTVWTKAQLTDYVEHALDVKTQPMVLGDWPVIGPEWDWQVGVVAVKP